MDVRVDNLFALLEGDEDATTLIEAAKAKVAAAQDKQPLKKVEETVSIPNPTRAKRLPHHSEQNYSNVHSNTNQHAAAVGNDNNNIGSRRNNRYKGNYSNANGNQGSYRVVNDGQEHNRRYDGVANYSHDRNNRRRYHGGDNYVHERNNNRRFYGDPDGYQGGSKGAYRNNNNGGNSDLQRDNGSVNGDQTEKRVDNIDNANDGGWQIQGRRRHNRFSGYNLNERKDAIDNQDQNGDDSLKQVKGTNSSLNSNESTENDNGNVEGSNADKRDLENVIQEALNGENNGYVVQSKVSIADNAEAASGSNEGNGVIEGEKDSEGSKNKESGKKKDESKKNGKKQVDGDYKNKMTLQEYEKLQLEKRKTLDSLKKTERRIVTLDKDFESMKLVEKKTEDDLSIKQNSEKDTRKKKDNKKSMSIDEFLKPAYGRGRGQWHHRRPFGGLGIDGERTFGGRGINRDRPNNGGTNSNGNRSSVVRGINGDRPNNVGRNSNGNRSYSGQRPEGEKSDNVDGAGLKKPNGRGESR